jgi:hypothetical protein
MDSALFDGSGGRRSGRLEVFFRALLSGVGGGRHSWGEGREGDSTSFLKGLLEANAI